VRNNLSRIAGWALLACAVALLIFSPPGFNILHFYAFIFCFVCGFLLASGMIGTDPLAARLRREMIETGTSRTAPRIHVPEQSFPYAGSPRKRKWATGICFLMGLGLTGLGVLIAFSIRSKAGDRILAGIPLWACGLLFIWISIRYPTRSIQVTPEGITLYGYFRTVAMPWPSVLVLTAREHFALIVGGIISTGVLYSLYSDRCKLSFSSQLPGSERLASIVVEATGLTWNSKPVSPQK
jgi:hypothetical protein